jgi:hypothetical protein
MGTLEHGEQNVALAILERIAKELSIKPGELVKEADQEVGVSHRRRSLLPIIANLHHFKKQLKENPAHQQVMAGIHVRNGPGAIRTRDLLLRRRGHITSKSGKLLSFLDGARDHAGLSCSRCRRLPEYLESKLESSFC